jgi:hypothetical protein
MKTDSHVRNPGRVPVAIHYFVTFLLLDLDFPFCGCRSLPAGELSRQHER